jgi:hypothetical protein
LPDYNAKAHKSKEITEFWLENRHTAKTIWSKIMLYDKNVSKIDEKIEKILTSCTRHVKMLPKKATKTFL